MGAGAQAREKTLVTRLKSRSFSIISVRRVTVGIAVFIRIFYIFFFQGNNRLTDASVKVLAKSCPMLDHVYLVDCPRITDLALKALASSKHLNVVNVADCVR